MTIQREDGWVYGTKVTKADGTAYGGFRWPDKPGPVDCPDWNPEPVCGGGLHFWEDGCGDVSVADVLVDSRWYLVRAKDEDVVRLDGKVKAKRVEVLLVGNKATVGGQMCLLAPAKQVIHGTATAGDKGTATAGDYGTATAGDKGTATAGDYGTATAGDYGTATAGDEGTATAGDKGTATAGDYGTATAGYYGTATAGDYGTATAGDKGTATAGDKGILQIKWWDEKKQRQRIIIAYVGEDGIEPKVAYKLDSNGKFVQA
jgi:hypothetical protein